jgi:hypothetical protein
MKYQVLIADYLNFDMLAEIPYLLSAAACEVNVFARKGSWLIQNSFCHQAVTAPEEPGAFLEAFKKCISEKEYDWIILGDDALIRMVNEGSFSENLLKKVLPISSLHHAPMLSSKVAFSQTLASVGIPTPLFAVYDGAESVEAAIARVGLPLILKLDTGEGGKGVFFATDTDAAKKILDTVWRAGNKILLQRYVKGKNIAVEALYRNGVLLAYTYAEVIKTLENEFGISSRRRYYPQESVVPLLETVGRKLSLHGFASITLLSESATMQALQIIEIDMRPQTWFRPAIRAGVDFSNAIRLFLSGEQMKPSGPTKKVMLYHFPRDLVWSIKQFDIIGAVAWLLGDQRRWQTIPWYDTKVVQAHLSRLVRSLSQSIKNKLRLRDTIKGNESFYHHSDVQ